MAESTIEWTQHTWNVVTGCQKISPGCAHCYAADIAKRFWGDRPFNDVQFHPERLDAPLRRRKPTTYFVNSMSDLFHESVTDEQLDQVFAVMALTPHHTYQCLTKRPQRMMEYCAAKNRASDIAIAVTRLNVPPAKIYQNYQSVWPLPNAWLGVTCENQKTADERIPLLLQTPAAVRFLSCEPLLEAIDFLKTPRVGETCDYLTGERESARGKTTAPQLDLVIVGGESGPKARVCDIDWIRSIVEQCKSAGVPVFVKQLGTHSVIGTESDNPTFYSPSKGKGNNPAEWPEDLRVREMPMEGDRRCSCGESADGLDDIHCQLCWERLCSDLWWQVVGGLQEVMMEGDRTTPNT